MRKWVTPMLARTWLTMPTAEERLLDWKKVRMYGEQMANGEWTNEDSPVVLEGNTLLDGQHRLAAVVVYTSGAWLWVKHVGEPVLVN